MMDGKMELLHKPTFDHIEDDREVKKEDNLSPKFKRQIEQRKELPDVIIIEDDDESDKVDTQCPFLRDDVCDDAYDSDANSSRFESCSNRERGWQNRDGFNEGPAEFSGNSYDDDCFVMCKDPTEIGPSSLSWCLQSRAPKGEKRPANNGFISNKSRKTLISSSDCEIIEDLDGKVRQVWEKAALMKRLGNAYMGGSFTAESEESTSATNPVGSTVRQSSDEKSNLYSQGREKTQPCQPGPSSYPFVKERDSTPVTLLDQQDSNHVCLHARLNSGEETSVADTSRSTFNNSELFEERASCSHLNSVSSHHVNEMLLQEDGGVLLQRQDDDLGEQRVPVEATVKASLDNLFVIRERVMDVEQLQHAEEVEWARCWQQAVQRQAQEVQYQWKKRKIEAEHKMEMESRQRRRLEEIRQSHQKEEENLCHKEEVHGCIRSELEDVAAACMDMATLLRNLGVEVDGGVVPSIQQVNAAYKRALRSLSP